VGWVWDELLAVWAAEGFGSSEARSLLWGNTLRDFPVVRLESRKDQSQLELLCLVNWRGSQGLALLSCCLKQGISHLVAGG
jgi:hypothetical protein